MVLLSNIEGVSKIKLYNYDYFKSKKEKYPFQLYETLIKKSYETELISFKYKTRNNLEVHAFIMKPLYITNPLPCIIYNRPGVNHEQFDYSMELTPPNMFNRYGLYELVETGKYIVVVSNLRGTKDGEGNDEYGGKDVNDILDLYEVIKELMYIDETRIGMYGVGRGTMMSFLVNKQVNWLKCIVCNSVMGVYKINKKYDQEYYDKISRLFKIDDKKSKEISAYFWVDQFPKNVPILLLHGNKDTRTHVDNALLMAGKFQRYQIPYQLVIYNDTTHTLFEKKDKYIKEMIEWFDMYLQ